MAPRRKDMLSQYWYDKSLNIKKKDFGDWIKKREIRFYGENNLYKSFTDKVINNTNEFIGNLMLDIKISESDEENPINRLFRDMPIADYFCKKKVQYINNPSSLRYFTSYSG